MSKAYGIFAQFYDTLTSNIDYAKRAQYFDSVVRKYGGKQGGILLDLACGTGSLSEQMDALGYDVIAVDNSMEMLGIAMEKSLTADGIYSISVRICVNLICSGPLT